MAVMVVAVVVGADVRLVDIIHYGGVVCVCVYKF